MCGALKDTVLNMLMFNSILSLNIMYACYRLVTSLILLQSVYVWTFPSKFQTHLRWSSGSPFLPEHVPHQCTSLRACGQSQGPIPFHSLVPHQHHKRVGEAPGSKKKEKHVWDGSFHHPPSSLTHLKLRSYIIGRDEVHFVIDALFSNQWMKGRMDIATWAK